MKLLTTILGLFLAVSLRAAIFQNPYTTNANPTTTVGVMTNVTPEQFGALGNGVTDDTAAIQAAIYTAEAGQGGGVVKFGSKPYAITQLVTTNPVTLLGNGCYGLQGSYTNSNGTVNYATINFPTIAPYVVGSVLHVLSTNTDAIVCSNLGVGFNFLSMGIRWPTNTAFILAGNGIACRPPSLDTNFDNGIQDFRIQDAIFWGVGSNSYAISLYNELYGTVDHVRSIGGGGIELASLMDTPNGGQTYYPGNLSVRDLNEFIVQNGLAKGIYIHGHTNGDGAGGNPNISLFMRCQAATWNATATYPWTTAPAAFSYVNAQSPIYVDNTAQDITFINCAHENTSGGGPFIFPASINNHCAWIAGDAYQQAGPLTNSFSYVYNNNVFTPTYLADGITFGKNSQNTKMQIRMLDWGDASSGGPFYQGFQENGTALDTYMAPGNAPETWSSWTPSTSASGAPTLGSQVILMSLSFSTGILSISNGLASNGSISLAGFMAGGITNTTSVNLEVWGFAGTTVTLSNRLTKFNVSLGTITTPQTFVLQPGDMLYGTACTEATNRAF